MSTPRVPRDCYLYLWYLCARYVSLAPISCMMHNIRVVLMRGEAGPVAVISYNNNIYLLDQKPCIEDLFTSWVHAIGLFLNAWAVFDETKCVESFTRWRVRWHGRPAAPALPLP